MKSGELGEMSFAMLLLDELGEQALELLSWVS